MAPPREIFDCERVRSYLESYLEGQVPPPEGRAIRLHFQRCRQCWSRVMERDPLQLFSPLADEEPGEEIWDGFWEAVRDGIHRPAPRREGFLSGLARPSFAWAAAAALLVIAVVALARPWLPGGRQATPPGVAAGGERAGAPGRAGPVIPASGPSLPTVQEVRSPTAQVLTMKVYEEDERVTEVVLIVDPEMEL